MWLFELFLEGLLGWAAQTRPAWLLLLRATLVTAGWFVLRLNVYAGIALLILGTGTGAYGLFLMFAGKGDE